VLILVPVIILKESAKKITLKLSITNPAVNSYLYL